MTSSIFRPTYLYIKQHLTTGKLYFGKTVKNPETYLGSGVHWKRHINKHGKENVVTLWYCLFFDEESITSFAVLFSNQQNIVESDNWLNLIPENGLDGGLKGISFSDKHKENISKAKVNEGKWVGENNPYFGSSRCGQLNPFYGKTHSDETKQIIKKKRGLQVFSEETKEKHRNNSKGENNPRAMCVNIFNNHNELMYECKGCFYGTCKTNKLPTSLLVKSFKNSGEMIVPRRRNAEKFRGWYAIRSL